MANNLDNVLIDKINETTPPAEPETPTLHETSEDVSDESQSYHAYSADASLPDESPGAPLTPESAAPSINAEPDLDEYGNERPKDRVYTEEEVRKRINEAVRERLSRGSQPTDYAQTQNGASDFEYDPNSTESWQVQLESFVKQTISKMGQEEIQRREALQRQESHARVVSNFEFSKQRFPDFEEKVKHQPISDSMTMALQAIEDPGAFIYAASTHHSSELKRISELPNPLAQMVEIGKLEERMRKAKSTTKTPRPIPKTGDDFIQKDEPKKKVYNPDILAKSDAQRRSILQANRGRLR